MTDRCSIPRCRGEVDIIYLDHDRCDYWNELNAGDAPASALRMVLGIEDDADPALEDTMARKKTDETTTETAAQAAPETTAKPARKPRSKGQKATAAKQTDKPAEAPTPTQEKKKEELCVFALRMTPAERTALHEAAGPRNATSFARRILVAFSNEDTVAFEAVVKEARELR